MKNIKFLALSVLVLCIPVVSHAISGTCSSHGGVNCSVGASYSGKAQCNDGWVDSSVYFSDVIECKNIKHSCNIEEYNDLFQKYNMNDRKQNIESLSADQQRAFDAKYSGKEGTTGSSSFYDISIELSKLQREFSTDLEIVNRECDALGEKTYWSNQAKIFTEAQNTQEQISQLQYTQVTPTVNCSSNQYVNNGKCSNQIKVLNGVTRESITLCNPGFTLINSKCLKDATNLLSGTLEKPTYSHYFEYSKKSNKLVKKPIATGCDSSQRFHTNNGTQCLYCPSGSIYFSDDNKCITMQDVCQKRYGIKSKAIGYGKCSNQR